MSETASSQRIVSFIALKGGVGKTTVIFNFAEWLAAWTTRKSSKGKKILLVDLDHQCNLSQTYNVYDTEGTVASIFDPHASEPVKIHHVKENIDLIAGFLQLDTIERQIENKANKDMLLYMWLADHYEELDLGQYDYILIDCHNDFGTISRNAAAVSHAIISPLEPSKHGYNAKFNIATRLDEFKAEVIDYRTRESLVTAELFFVTSKTKKTTKSSKELLEAVKGDTDVIGNFPHREIVNESIMDAYPLCEMAQKKSYNNKEAHDFFDTIEKSFKSMKKHIDSISA